MSKKDDQWKIFMKNTSKGLEIDELKGKIVLKNKRFFYNNQIETNIRLMLSLFYKCPLCSSWSYYTPYNRDLPNTKMCYCCNKRIKDFKIIPKQRFLLSDEALVPMVQWLRLNNTPEKMRCLEFKTANFYHNSIY